MIRKTRMEGGQTVARVGFVLGVSFIGIAYMAFLAGSCFLIIHAMFLEPAPDQSLLHSDFARMWYVGRKILAGLHAVPEPLPLPEGDILSPLVQRTAAWLYPPPAGLVAMLFALPPLFWAFWVWRASCLMFGYFLMRHAGLPRAAVVLGLIGPAGLLDLGGGQIGTLTGSLFVASLLYAEKHPRLAGLCAGILAIKPQIALAVPFAWARKYYRVNYLAAVVAVLAMLLASWLLEGRAAWIRYFSLSLPASLDIAKEPFAVVLPAQGFTVSYLLRSLGIPTRLAFSFQYIASVLALAAVWLAWQRNRMANIPRMILTVCLSLLATPYGYAYSLVGYSVAMMVLVVRLKGWPVFFAAILWLMGGYTMTIYNLTGLLVFPLCAIAGSMLAWRFRHEPALQ